MCRKVTGALKITHERWKKDKATRGEKVPPAVRSEFAAAIRSNEQIEQHLSKARLTGRTPSTCEHRCTATLPYTTNISELIMSSHNLLLCVVPTKPLFQH